MAIRLTANRLLCWLMIAISLFAVGFIAGLLDLETLILPGSLLDQ